MHQNFIKNVLINLFYGHDFQKGIEQDFFIFDDEIGTYLQTPLLIACVGS